MGKDFLDALVEAPLDLLRYEPKLKRDQKIGLAILLIFWPLINIANELRGPFRK